MNFTVPLKWFQEAVGYAVTVEELQERVGDLGFDIQIHDSLFLESLVVVSKVISTEAHPNAERLKICQVDAAGEILQIVCGCPSVAANMFVPLAKVGANLPNLTIKSSVIRNIESNGMLCSRADLGLEKVSRGLWQLSGDLEVGRPLYNALGYDGPVIVFEVTPNRTDCLSLEGIVREYLALLCHKKYKKEFSYVFNNSKPVSLPSYAKNAFWLKISLQSEIKLPQDWICKLDMLGLYHVNPILCIQRLVEVHYGLPLHIYTGNMTDDWSVDQINESLDMLCLDDQSRCLSSGDVVVKNEKNIVALACMIGSSASRYLEGETSFWLEALEIDYDLILATKRRLQLNTEAAIRASRGVASGLSRRTVCGFLEYLSMCASIKIEAVVSSNNELSLKQILLHQDSLTKLLGFNPDNKAIEALECLGFVCNKITENDILVTVPWYRSDVMQECDLIEEVIRWMGYACLSEPPIYNMATVPKIDILGSIDEHLASLGFDEAITYSFIEPYWHEYFAVSNIWLANPISVDLSLMRPSLMPSLWSVAKHRFNNQSDSVLLFEHGKSYFLQDKDIIENAVVALLISGEKYLPSPKNDKRFMDYYDLQQMVTSVFDKIACAVQFKVIQSFDKVFHPDVIAGIYVENQYVGFIAMVHPGFTKDYPNVFYAELDESFINNFNNKLIYKDFDKNPLVYRDLSFWCPEGFVYESIDSFMHNLDIDYLHSWQIIDSYYANGAVQNQSISLRLCLSGGKKSLKDKEVETIVSTILLEISSKLLLELRSNENINAC